MKPLVRQKKKTWLTRIAFGLVEIKNPRLWYEFWNAVILHYTHSAPSINSTFTGQENVIPTHSIWNCSFSTLIYVRQFKIFIYCFFPTSKEQFSKPKYTTSLWLLSKELRFRISPYDLVFHFQRLLFDGVMQINDQKINSKLRWSWCE